MMRFFLKRRISKLILSLVTISLFTCVQAADNYTSKLVNKSSDANGYRLVKTRMWPNAECLLDTGKDIINPGETTTLTIKNDKQCNQGGIGYEIYNIKDTKKEHLYGYLSHRFADGKFSLQISRFCEGDQCVFVDLNPSQKR